MKGRQGRNIVAELEEMVRGIDGEILEKNNGVIAYIKKKYYLCKIKFKTQ